ncbi:B-box type zinc finger family protein [Striga asiatica]|uniref:B-box type zinc finger family protein n=1 Tax=Striga asiatica TaxID=4170 RepID=A0A5A7P3U8_STRAF|nr:B-box type zinc finger family protein [Striga asiatica]
MKKKCELCKNIASMYCNSDRASLCWDCDSHVHMANFLVAKHIRTLLCRACQSPTSWTGSGPKLGPTISLCDKCIRCGKEKTDDDDDDNDYDDDNDDDEIDDDDDDGENQVVPLSPPYLASTSSKESSSRGDGFSGSGSGFGFPGLGFGFSGARTDG